ncbi:MAG: TonB-dependent receptor [Crocinitomicaceae bacterium]|nr:TonB-dependent receptor [Crocinitomicaceae bacterium]
MRLIAFFFLFFSTGLYAQNTQTIRGTVKDKETFQPIIGAKVILLNSDPIKGSVTDIDGKFRLEGVPVGRQAIQITFVGYEPVTLPNIDVVSKEVVLNIEMVEAVTMMNAVEVVANEQGESINKMATLSTRTFSVEESNRYAGTKNDVARMAQNYAGVQGADDSRNDIVIRGNSPTGVLFRMEGVDIPNPNHFARFGTTGGPISILNNNVLANSDFMTGAFPSEYGNAIAGVFDLKMRTGNNEKHEFMFQIGFNGAELMAEGPISRKTGASYLVNYRYSTLELFSALGINIGTTSLPNYQDLSFKLNFPSKKGVTSVFGIGGYSYIEILAENADSTDLFALDYSNTSFDSRVGVVGVAHKQRLGKSAYFNISTGMQGNLNRITNDTVDLAFNNPFTTYRSNSTVAKWTGDIFVNHKLSAKHTYKVGLHSDYFLLNLNDSLYRTQLSGFDILHDFKGNVPVLQPYVAYQYRPLPNLTFNGGVHGQYVGLNNELMIEPRAGVSYNFTEKDRLSFAYGLHSQLQPLELYFNEVQDEFGASSTPNTELEMTKSHHFVMAYQHRFNYGINLKIESYYQKLYDVPVAPDSSNFSILNFGADFTTILPDVMVNEGEGENYGVEITIEKYLDKGFYFMVNSSIYESFYTSYSGEKFNTAFNGNFTFNALGGYEFRFKPGKKFQNSLTLDGKFMYNGGRRFTPILYDLSVLYGTEIRDVNQSYTSKYKDYVRGDVRVAFKMVGKNITQEWALDVQNITAYKNIFIQEYDPILQQTKTTYQTGRLPIFQYRIYF